MMLKDLVKKFGVLLVLTMLVAVCVGAGSAADWTTYLGNDQRNGYVAEDGPQTNKTLWMFDNPQMNQYIQSPVVSGDKVYFSIWGGSLTPNLYCYNITTGTQEWSQTIESGARAGITLSDDSLYVSSYNSQTSVGEVFKVDLETGAIEGHTGELVKVGTYGLTSTPIISEDSVWINTYKEVTSSSVETHLYEYSLDLAEQKNKIVIANTTGGSGGYYASPALSPDGKLLYISGNSSIIAYNTTDATIEWETNLGLSYPQYRTATPVYSNGVIYLVGHAYVNSVTSKIYAVDAVSGEIRWVKEGVSTAMMSSPVVTDSVIILSSSTGLNAYNLVDTSATPVWSFTGVSGAQNSPVVAGDTVYYTTGKNAAYGAFVYAVNATTGESVWTYDVSYSSVSSNNGAKYQNMFEGAPAVVDGVLYVGDARSFYAFSDSGSSAVPPGEGTEDDEESDDDPENPPETPDTPEEAEVVFDGVVTLTYDEVDLVLSDGSTKKVAGNSAGVALAKAAENGEFTYNISVDPTHGLSLDNISGIDGYQDSDGNYIWWAQYHNGGFGNGLETSLSDGDNYTFYYCDGDINNATHVVNIKVQVKPVVFSDANVVFDGEVILKSKDYTLTLSNGARHAVDGNCAAVALVKAAELGGFDYNISVGDLGLSLDNISGKGYSQNGDSNGVYWNQYHNGQMSAVGLGAELSDGDYYTFYYTAYGDHNNATDIINIKVHLVPDEAEVLFDGVVILKSEDYTLKLQDGSTKTVAGNLAAVALDKASKVAGFEYNITDSTSGLYVPDIDGQGWDATTGAYWNTYHNGEYDMVGVSAPLSNGDVYTFYYCNGDVGTATGVITIKVSLVPDEAAVLFDGEITLTAADYTLKLQDGSTKTVAGNLAAVALDKVSKAAGFEYNITDSTSGLYVPDIDGQGWDATTGAYWNTYHNGEYDMVGVSAVLSDGDFYTFYYCNGDISTATGVINILVNVVPENTGGQGVSLPIIKPTIIYQSFNPGTGSFEYTTTYGSIYTVDRMTPFGVLYASGHSIKSKGASGIFVYSINGYDNYDQSGWMYTVNGIVPSVNSNSYPLSNGDKVIWYFSDSMASTPESSSVKYAFVVSLPAGTLPTQTTNTTNTTNVTQVVLPPAEKVIPETKPIENTTGMVILEKTNTVKRIQVPVEILTENPNASVKVVEGNTEEVKLPANVTAENVHLILEVSVVDKEGEKISVDKPGHFVLDAEVPAGKQILVGHFNETAGIWENCPVEQLPNGQWKVTYYSLSPFSVLFLDEGKENPFVIIEAPEEPEQTEPDTTNETKPVETPAEEAKSPLAAAWLIPGIFALYAGLKRRNN